MNFSFIRTLTVGLVIATSHACARGLYHRWGISPRPENVSCAGRNCSKRQLSSVRCSLYFESGILQVRGRSGMMSVRKSAGACPGFLRVSFLKRSFRKPSLPAFLPRRTRSGSDSPGAGLPDILMELQLHSDSGNVCSTAPGEHSFHDFPGIGFPENR